jgi:hypothetical protein
VIFTNGLGHLRGVRGLELLLPTEADGQVVAVITRSDSAIQTCFHPNLLAFHADADRGSADLVALASELNRVIVGDSSLLHMAEHCRQIVQRF